MTAKAEAKISAPNHNDALTILMEECAEVIQAAAKIKRFGPEKRNSETNLPFNSVLTNELADLYAILHLAEQIGALTPPSEQQIARAIERKRKYSSL